MSTVKTGPTVILGLGNPLMADDGVGIAALDGLRGLDLGPNVELVDGGTWGMSLLPTIEGAQHLVLVDAIGKGEQPGTLITLERHEIPRYLATKISPHQVALHDLLALAELRGNLPEHTVAIGIQPARVAMSVGLSPVVTGRLPELVAAVKARLALWNVLVSAATSQHA